MNTLTRLMPRLLALGLVITLGWPAAARLVHIDPDAATNGDGSLQSPFNTWAAVSFEPGNSYLQKRGTRWSETIEVDRSGRDDAWITIGSYGDPSLPRPLLATHNQPAVLVTDVSYIRLRDLRITVTGQERYWKTSGIFGHRGSHYEFINLKIGPTGAHGIYINDKRHVTVRGCEFFNAGTKEEWDSADNIHLENCRDYLVEHCVSYDCLQGAEYDASDGNDGYTAGVWRYNLAYDDAVEPGVGWSHYKMSGHHPNSRVELYYNISIGSVRGPGIALQEELTGIAVGNTIYNAAYGIQQSHDENIIVNNIIASCPLGMRLPDGKTPRRMDHNLWHDIETFAVFGEGDNRQIATLEDWRALTANRHSANDRLADPRFIDPALRNLALRPDSPAIDAGLPIDLPPRAGLHPESRWPDRTRLLDQTEHGEGWEIGAFVFPSRSQD